MTAYIAAAIAGAGAGTYTLDAPLQENDILVSIAAGDYGLTGVTVDGLGVALLTEGVAGKNAGDDAGATILLFAHLVTAEYAGTQEIAVVQAGTLKDPVAGVDHLIRR